MRIVFGPLLLLAACGHSPAEPPADPTATTASAPANASKMGGCKDVYLYAANDDATQVVIVDVDAKRVGLKKGERKTFDLGSAPKGVHVWLDRYLQPTHIENVHCTKVPSEPQMAERYAANAGTLTIELAEDGTVNATVEAAKFALEGRPTIEIATRRFEKIRV